MQYFASFAMHFHILQEYFKFLFIWFILEFDNVQF